LQLRFSLSELSEILRTRDSSGVPCHRVLHLAEEKLHSLGEQIEELQRTQAYMRRLVRDWRKKLKRTPRSSKAMLLQSLAEDPQKQEIGHEATRTRLLPRRATLRARKKR